ncbi:PREDICTED: uncharacterized protein LOC104800825 isoform X2 [Tarenaya hassleriana]|uniref:uncharacterized protein LOC104800825 isoform X2 n=1 Tax=Tarenaya hassleriana TaxID=28532 RepID=UPI00053C2300|nr:PREDICTED: uncharacterized protein LOC104800825 isoform X2 [Tarenaya hassleriana]
MPKYAQKKEMITKIGGGAMVVFRHPPPTASLRCFAASSNSNLLRSELDCLHVEAESTRSKANSARLRLLRLSEAAENLRRQAAVNIQTGKENDARELLVQKKKVMQALEKAKARIEVLDKLTSKLHEAISIKESQLVGSISVDLEVDRDDTPGVVHIVSPKPEYVQDENAGDDSKSEFNLDIGKRIQDENVGSHEPEDVSSSSIFTEVSSYETFLKNLDQQLEKIEDELVTILNVSSLVLNREEKPKNLKVQQMTEILDGIHSVRERIADIICAEAKTN